MSLRGMKFIVTRVRGEGDNEKSWGCTWEDRIRDLWADSHEDCFLGFTSPDEFSFGLFKFTLQGEKESHT